MYVDDEEVGEDDEDNSVCEKCELSKQLSTMQQGKMKRKLTKQKCKMDCSCQKDDPVNEITSALESISTVDNNPLY